MKAIGLISILGMATWFGGNGPSAPSSIVVATTRGEAVVPVTYEYGGPALAAVRLRSVLPVTSRVDEDWAIVEFADQPFRFLLNAPVLAYQGRTIPLVFGAYVARDTLFIPFEWLTSHIPRLFHEAYRYDPFAARFEETTLTPVVISERPPISSDYRKPPPRSPAARNGFRIMHRVVVDPGHGGRQPGNPGKFFPRGIQEKHITLAIGTRLRDQLEKRGVEVVMTRERDTFVDILERAPMCGNECDLFVSIHVNSLNARPGYQSVRGFETYFLDEARNSEAARVAAMENEVLRFDAAEKLSRNDPLAFIFKDLHANEYLRESARLAELVWKQGAKMHPGGARGVSQARFVVLGTARRPAILVETGYATNRSDAQFLTSGTGQQKLAIAIADGIVAYLKEYETKILGSGP